MAPWPQSAMKAVEMVEPPSIDSNSASHQIS